MVSAPVSNPYYPIRQIVHAMDALPPVMQDGFRHSSSRIQVNELD